MKNFELLEKLPTGQALDLIRLKIVNEKFNGQKGIKLNSRTGLLKKKLITKNKYNHYEWNKNHSILKGL